MGWVGFENIVGCVVDEVVVGVGFVVERDSIGGGCDGKVRKVVDVCLVFELEMDWYVDGEMVEVNCIIILRYIWF